MCKNCGKPLLGKYQKLFCSRSCSASTNNRGKTKNSKKVKRCLTCNNPTIKRAKFCPNHSRNYDRTAAVRDTPLEHYNKKYASPEKPKRWRSSHITELNRRWNKELRLLPCQVCGYIRHVELAHIKAISSFSSDTPIGKINDPANILVLCPNHHWEFDNGFIAIESIPPR